MPPETAAFHDTGPRSVRRRTDSMSFSYRAYRLVSTGLFMPVAAPVLLFWHLTGKPRENLLGRLGRYENVDRKHPPGRPRIWLHAASVGEVKAAAAVAAVLKEKLPASSLVVSSVTETGQAEARRMVDRRTACLYAPLDAPFAVRSALNGVRPDLLAICETELWPNWLAEARRLGVRTALINGRISVRSFRRYMRILPLIGPVLDNLQTLSMISAGDAERIRRMGADDRRIRINGNAKYDGLAHQAREASAQKMSKLLCLTGEQPVLVAGSVRGAEISALLDAFCRIRARLPETVLVAAPRHLQNAGILASAAARRGLAVQRRSTLGQGRDRRTAPVVVLDTFGELMAAYGTATVAFCGGSLAPLGGQNILEPAAWGKPVLYGPSTEDFSDAREILERRGGGEEVADAAHLADRVLHYLLHPDAAALVGRKARSAAASQSGAATRHAQVILELLENGKKESENRKSDRENASGNQNSGHILFSVYTFLFFGREAAFINSQGEFIRRFSGSPGRWPPAPSTIACRRG